jgi:ethanolamine utilization protein EutP (predicted NTPase)
MHKTSTQAAIYRHNASYKRKARIQGRGGITSAKPGYKGEAALQAQSPDTRVIALVRAAAAVNSAMSNNLRNLWIAAIVVVSVVI